MARRLQSWADRSLTGLFMTRRRRGRWLCSLVDTDWCFRGAYSLHHQKTHSTPWKPQISPRGRSVYQETWHCTRHQFILIILVLLQQY
jgi:hypothetical protein